MPTRVAFELDGCPVEVDDDGRTLLEVLRDELGARSVKDGCSPQGQCGCCTVLVDGAPRVACVTPARRVAGRRITTVDGLDDAATWADGFVATGGSQCGFCTPGIVCRLSALRDRQPDADHGAVTRALAAHLCRCTGWQTILEAWNAYGTPDTERDLDAAGWRAALEGRAPQVVGAEVPLGRVGFADDTAPPDALVAVPDVSGGWAVGGSLAEARQRGGKVQGRRSTESVVPPLALPAGDWAIAVRTSWVEPAYLETDASWCAPGGTPASSSANGGAFGGKQPSIAEAAARELADLHGRPVRVLLSREDVVRHGPKRPPVSIGMRPDGTGVARVVATPGVADAIRSVAPGLVVEEVGVVSSLSTSTGLRAVGWGEAAIVLAGLRGDRSVEVTSPEGARATALVRDDGGVEVTVRCGAPLDEVVLRSYCIGATHMALGWVRSEGVAVDDEGLPVGLTIRSFGIIRPGEMPPVEVTVEPDDGQPVNGSDAVFVAVAAAEWIRQGRPVDWPTGRT